MLMITVREAVDTLELTKNKELCIAFEGNSTPVNADSTLFMDAYGDYIVSKIVVFDEDVELDILMLPQKAPK